VKGGGEAGRREGASLKSRERVKEKGALLGVAVTTPVPRLWYNPVTLSTSFPFGKNQGKQRAKYSLLHLMSSIKNIKPTFFRRQANQNSTHTLQINRFSTKYNLKMPLVVPGINSTGEGSKTDEWMNKLVGKKIGETSDATVCTTLEDSLL
jgi:hypothetical protein